MKTRYVSVVLVCVMLTLFSFPCRAANGAVFSPHVLDFGHVPWGATNTQLVTVTLTGEHLNDTSPPRLVLIGSRFLASNLRVTLLAQRRTGDTRYLTYAVTLPEIIGPLHGLLTLEINSPVKLGALPFIFQGKLVDCPYYPNGTTLMGDIFSRLQASPASVDFGPVPAGQGASVVISLRSPNLMESPSGPHLAKSLTVSPSTSLGNTPHSSQSAWVSLVDVAGSASAEFVWELWRLRLDPKTPPRALKTSVTFNSPDGQVIVVPVTATVVGARTVSGHKAD